MMPTLKTDRLLLRPRRLGDLEACFQMDREPGTLEFIDWPGSIGSWQDTRAHRAFIRARILHGYPAGMGYWVIQDHAHARFLGWVLLIPEDTKGPEIEIGWRLPKSARGRGFATEAAARVLAFGFCDLGLRQVVADINPANTASRRVAEKIGLEESGPTPAAPHLLRYRANAGGATVGTGRPG